jgi:predicted nucleic acid-binding protein
LSELDAMTDYDDIHGAAASNVLAADEYYAVIDPYERDGTPAARPEFGLDEGETDGIVLATSLGVDGFLTDEFGGTNFALVHAALRGPRIVPTPRLIRDYARGGHMSTSEAQQLLDIIGSHRSWGASPYVALLRDQLES